MAGKVVATPQQAVSFEYELFEGDPDNLRTVVVATSSQRYPWIDPPTLKLRHRIGRGPFGDVWLATHHQSTQDYDEYHEVAIKMLYPVKEDHVKAVLDKFNAMFSKCHEIDGICWIHGISVLSGKICVVMKFYEGSVADKMALIRGGRLSFPDVIRYGIDLAQGISGLHSKEILVLNLKPASFLLNDKDQAILGDIGIPYLLLGVPFLSSDMDHRLGTPNYMAPEQWEPEIRGPISFETDAWGFGCSIVEMLTGFQPWRGISADEIYHEVVIKHGKPPLPTGLPLPVENVLLGCFEYDFRSRPLISDILSMFQSVESALKNDEGWTGSGGQTILKELSMGYTEWFLSKDRLEVGDTVRSRKSPKSCKAENMEVPEGIVVGLEGDADRGDFALVKVHGIHDPLRVKTSTIERVSLGLAAGDWVRLKEEGKKHSPVGVLHSIDRDGNVAVGFIGIETLWKGHSSQFQMAKSFCVGQFVNLKANVLSPRFGWPRKSGGAWATGRISWILPNGCLVVKFPGRLPFADNQSSYLADPAEVEVVTFNNCPGMVKKYQHLEDFHWAVRPLLIAFCLFTTTKVGFCIGKRIGRAKSKKHQVSAILYDAQNADENPAWLPSPVANIFQGK